MARCECGAQIAEGCQCAVADSDCFSVGGSGSDANPFLITANFDPDADNLLECGANGLGAFLPSYITDPDACCVHNTLSQSIPNAFADALNFNVDLYDTNNMHNPFSLNPRIVFQVDGIYTVTLNCAWNNNSAGDRAAFVRKNGVDYLALDSKHAGDADLEVGHSIIVQEAFVAGDYVEAIVKQDSGGALSIVSDRYSPNFAATFRRRLP